jgi:nicotinamidase-related amidase
MKKTEALLVIDVQNGMFSDPDNPVFREEQLISVIKRLIQYFRGQNIPVIYIQHNGASESPLEKDSVGWEFRHEIKPNNSDIVIQKDTPNSFLGTNLKSTLDELKAKDLIICGLQSELCIDTTCRQAKAFGYNITLVKDAHSTFNTELLPAKKIWAHHNSVLGDWFATIKNSSEILPNEK